MKNKFYLIGLFIIIFLTPGMAQDNSITIDFSKKGVSIPANRYGVFFEEINHAGDGGLYAELIQNRGFEDKAIPATCKYENGYLVPIAKPNYLSGKIENWKIPWDTTKKWPGWSLRLWGPSRAVMSLTTHDSLNSATPHSMKIEILRAQPREPVELVNSGYWGIAVKKGERYTLRFYLKADKSYMGSVIAKIRDENDVILAKNEFRIPSQGNWNEYTCTFTAKKTKSNAVFILSFNTIGKVWVDYVSLFPENTFKNRKNGLRVDVAQKIADLKPAFMRWPGGCIVEGFTLENRVKWKETLGDPAKRPGTYNLWGYRNSYGFGYHEFLQFCEDIGAQGMFVCNAGFSCAYRNGDYASDEEVQPFIQDALDAIEYAIGDSTSKWGKERVKNGHPAMFPLKYIEVGNENYGPLYAKRFNLFYKAIKAKYPEITVISSLQFDPELKMIEKTDMIDPHYYNQPEWFYRNTNLFDSKTRGDFKVYVGEYACNQGVGSGNMNAALSEAAFMTGMERNSDLVTMCSYAPLIENSNDRKWPVNLIWLKNNKVFGRSSYYVQKLFSENKPDVNIHLNLQLSGADLPKPKFQGLVGLGTSGTQAVFKNFSIKQEKEEYSADYNNRQIEWEPESGHWRVESGNYLQGDLEPGRATFLRKKMMENCTIEVNALKSKGKDGLSIIFGGKNYRNYYQFAVGVDSNKYAAIQKIEGGSNGIIVSDSIPFKLEENKWYDLKVTITGDEAECFVNDKPVLKYKIKELEKRYAIAGFDETKNEIVIKVVNAEGTPMKTSLKLLNTGEVQSEGEAIILSANSKDEENTFRKPEKIYPENKKVKRISGEFKMEFKPFSLTVLRIKRR